MSTKVEKPIAKPSVGLGLVKWSVSNIQVFLECYEKHELLWNIRHVDYVNKQKRESGMIKLKGELVELGVQVPDLGFLRGRIKAIKSTYRNALLKINESKKSGAGTDEVYVPKLPWFSTADRFMRGVVITRTSKSNLVTPGTADVIEEDLECELSATEQSVSILLEDGATADTTEQVAPSFQPTSAKKPRLSKLTKVENAIDKLNKITAYRQSATTHQADEAEVFGKYVAAQLRDLPIRNRLTMQDKIQSMLTRERIALLSATPSQFSPMLSHNSSSLHGMDSDDDNTEFTVEGQNLYKNL